MTPYGLLMGLPLVLLLLWAAAEDLRSRRIPNWLSFSLILCGLVQAIVFSAPGLIAADLSAVQSMLGVLTGLGLTIFPFAFGAMGAGDVKLLAGVGAWLGPGPVFHVFLAAAILGMLIVLAQALWQRRLRKLLRNTAVVTLNLLHMAELGVDNAVETGQSARSIDRPLPYAVPVLLATLAVVAQASLGARASSPAWQANAAEDGRFVAQASRL